MLPGCVQEIFVVDKHRLTRSAASADVSPSLTRLQRLEAWTVVGAFVVGDEA